MAIAIVLSPTEARNILNKTQQGLVRRSVKFYKAVKNDIEKYGNATIVCVCSKGGKSLCFDAFNGFYELKEKWNTTPIILNGKVICKFECENVEDIKLPYTYFGTNKWVGCENDRKLQTETINEEQLLKLSCLKEEEIYKYLNFKKSPDYVGVFIHISNLKIFETPKEIKELIKPHTLFDIAKVECHKKDIGMCNDGLSLKTGKWIGCNKFRLTQAPRNFVHVEDLK